MQISRALRGMLKKYFKNLYSFNQILFHFIMYFYQHFYFSVSSIIDSFYKFQLRYDSKALLIIYMLKGTIVIYKVLSLYIAVLPKRFPEESWVLE